MLLLLLTQLPSPPCRPSSVSLQILMTKPETNKQTIHVRNLILYEDDDENLKLNNTSIRVMNIHLSMHTFLHLLFLLLVVSDEDITKDLGGGPIVPGSATKTELVL